MSNRAMQIKWTRVSATRPRYLSPSLLWDSNLLGTLDSLVWDNLLYGNLLTSYKRLSYGMNNP